MLITTLINLQSPFSPVCINPLCEKGHNHHGSDTQLDRILHFRENDFLNMSNYCDNFQISEFQRILEFWRRWWQVNPDFALSLTEKSKELFSLAKVGRTANRTKQQKLGKRRKTDQLFFDKKPAFSSAPYPSIACSIWDVPE